MDRIDIVRDTYARYGLAMYQAQVLEHGIVNAMVYARLPDRHRITRGEIEAFMGRKFERTLGALLRELERCDRVPRLAADLARALRMRNRLAHEYFRERAVTFMTNEGCLTMIQDLQRCQALFGDVATRLGDLVRPIGERFGITEDAVAAACETMIADAERSNYSESA
jgi:hypothetical protein